MGGKTALGLDLNIGALLCYINICLPIGLIYSIIVLVQDKSNRLPRFHALQVLFTALGSLIVFIPLGFIVGIFAGVLGYYSPVLGLLVNSLFGLIMLVIGLALLYFVVMAAIKAYKGEIYKIPFVGNFAEKYV